MKSINNYRVNGCIGDASDSGTLQPMQMNNSNLSVGASPSSDIVFDKDWANDQLRFGIAVLEGRICRQPFPGSVADARLVEADLRVNGFKWQADRLNNHIGRVIRARGGVRP